MALKQYNKAKEKLFFIWYLEPSIEQIAKYVNLMYKSLCEEWGFLCRREIIAKIFNDTAEIGLPISKIKEFLIDKT